MIYFNGCSITKGAGFEQETQDPRIYPNLVTDRAINGAQSGNSNLKIFSSTARAIIDNLADIYVVQWSALHRHWLYPTPDSGIYIGSSHKSSDVFVTEFQLRNHDYYNILQLIDFTLILEKLAQLSRSSIVFVNGLVNWKNDLDWMYTLVSDAKSDHQYYVENLQNNMELVNWDLWVNPWHDMQSNKLDSAPLDNHPGPKTHRQIADKIVEYING